MTDFNNKLSVTLYVNGVQKQTKQFNGSTLTFSSLSFNVTNNAPVSIQLKANVNNDVLLETHTMAFNLQNINATDSNSQTITAPAAVNGVVFTIAGAGTTNVTANSSSADQGFAVANTTKKVGSFAVQAINDDLEVRGAYINLSGVAGYTNAGNIMTSFVVKNAAGTVVATETARSGANNQIVRFDNFVAGTIVPAGSSNTFYVHANVGALNSSTDGGEFVAKVDTSFLDSAYSGQIFSGVRLYSINAGTYVTAGTVTSASVGNTLNVVSSFPKMAKVADGDAQSLLTFSVSNASGSTNLLLSGITYFANAQSGGDIAKAFTLYNNSTVVATGTLVAGVATTIGFNVSGPLTIAAGPAPLQLEMRLDTPFIPTATNQNSNTRVFQISNVNYAQMFANGSTSTYANVSA